MSAINALVDENRDDRLLTTNEVAKKLNVSPSWVRAHATGRRMPLIQGCRLGKYMHFRRQDVEQFIETCRILAQDQVKRERRKSGVAA